MNLLIKAGQVFFRTSSQHFNTGFMSLKGCVHTVRTKLWSLVTTVHLSPKILVFQSPPVHHRFNGKGHELLKHRTGTAVYHNAQTCGLIVEYGANTIATICHERRQSVLIQHISGMALPISPMENPGLQFNPRYIASLRQLA